MFNGITIVNDEIVNDEIVETINDETINDETIINVNIINVTIQLLYHYYTITILSSTLLSLIHLVT